MAELPKSWGLRTRKNKKGTLDIIGKDDSGKDYKVRTTDTAGITDRDITELKAADRESYSNRESGAREFVKKLVGEEEKLSPIEAISKFDDSDWIAAAEPIVHAGFERKGLTAGYSRKYADNYDRVFGGK